MVGRAVEADRGGNVSAGLQALPDGWEPVEESMFATAFEQALRAFGDEDGIDRALTSVQAYFDPQGRYAGSTFLDVVPNDPFTVGAADLWAVTTLSMDVPPAAGRALLGPGPLRDLVERGLRRLPEDATLSQATPQTLLLLEETYHAIRTQLPSPRAGARATNQWVMASKLMARKRPLLFPVRDSLVCAHLTAGAGLGGKPGQLGWFRRDMQVFAYLMVQDEVRYRLDTVRASISRSHPTWSLGSSDLRLLDSVLWMAARQARS